MGDGGSRQTRSQNPCARFVPQNQLGFADSRTAAMRIRSIPSAGVARILGPVWFSPVPEAFSIFFVLAVVAAVCVAARLRAWDPAQHDPRQELERLQQHEAWLRQRFGKRPLRALVRLRNRGLRLRHARFRRGRRTQFLRAARRAGAGAHGVRAGHDGRGARERATGHRGQNAGDRGRVAHRHGWRGPRRGAGAGARAGNADAEGFHASLRRMDAKRRRRHDVRRRRQILF